ncbi:MAG: glycosyltransferase family 1 protein [Hydrococcus sp. C42_A2020_068]|nr:glycosyltransferase family 1 protein [Hydrococcus sp. C42_A2020_068]
MKKALVVGYTKDSITKAQQEPFRYYQKLLSRQLDLKIEHIAAESFGAIGEACKNQDAEIIFVLPFWNESSDQAEQVMQSLRQQQPTRTIVFIDPFAQVTSNYFNVLPHVDYFLKRQRYKNLDEYQRSFIGGSMFTDFLARELELDFSQWHVGSQVPKQYQHRIVSGWNLGSAKQFKQKLQTPSWFEFWQPAKEIDIFCRLSLGPSREGDWYYAYRQMAVESLKPLQSDYKVVSSGKIYSQLVSRRQYFREIKRSRIVFSPFGWGESCWRDFEAVCYNCLLVKPSMAHIETQPNIYVEGETYVPVSWDFSDLVEKCDYYLKHSDEAARIVKNARRAYLDYFERREFLQTIAGVINVRLIT